MTRRAMVLGAALVIAGCAANARQPAPQPVMQPSPAAQSTGFFALKACRQEQTGTGKMPVF